MNKPINQNDFARFVPDQFVALLDKPSLILGEKTEDYMNLFGAFVAEVKPIRVLEWIWLKDSVDSEWEARRLRRAKTPLAHMAMLRSAIAILAPLIAVERGQKNNPGVIDLSQEARNEKEAEKLYLDSLKGDRGAKERLERLLKSVALDESAIAASAIARGLDLTQQIDGMISGHHRTRDQILRDLDQRRAVLGARGQVSAPVVIDVQAKDASE